MHSASPLYLYKVYTPVLVYMRKSCKQGSGSEENDN